MKSVSSVATRFRLLLLLLLHDAVDVRDFVTFPVRPSLSSMCLPLPTDVVMVLGAVDRECDHEHDANVDICI